MRLTQKTQLAIKILYTLNTTKPKTAERIAYELNEDKTASELMSPLYVSNILRFLRVKGLVAAVRGPAGGYVLTTPREDWSVLAVVEALDGETDIKTGCPVIDLTHKLIKRRLKEIKLC